MSGSLVLVATPIGNLGDISFRAVETLKSANAIACEDTRHTRKLLNHYEITGIPLIAVHEHNEAEQAKKLVERIRNGEIIAYVTDAGTPGISDPGERLVKAVAAADLIVTIIPGASAAISALVISGLAADRFVFEGFLPRKAGERKQVLEGIALQTRTTIVYEAPNRLLKTLREMSEICGADREVAVVRELTKLYEEVQRGPVQQVIEHYESHEPKGECVIVIGGAEPAAEASDDDIREALSQSIADGSTKRDAINEVAKSLGVPKNRVYDIASR